MDFSFDRTPQTCGRSWRFHVANISLQVSSVYFDKEAIRMDRSPILIRCDASHDRSWEPIHRVMSYAAALQRRRRVAYIMGSIDYFPLVAQISRGGNEYLTAGHPVGSPDDLDETVRQVRRVGASGVMVHADDVGEEYLRELNSLGILVTVIDTEGRHDYRNCLVFNPYLSPSKRAFKLGRGTQLCTGADYAFVRSVFRRQRAIRATQPVGPVRALVAFGDDDVAGQTMLRCQEMLGATRVEKITAFVRSHHPEVEAIRDLANEHKSRMEVITELNELSTRLPRAHFALTSGDSTSLEMACVGIPQFVMTQHQRHLANAKSIDDAGAATYLGDASAVTAGDLRDVIYRLLDDPLERIGMTRTARRLIDGRGPDRTITALEIMLRATKATTAKAVA
jgi:spore coat polysaccharide biosynthesis predicted glycosyltransferase SpsG